MVGSPVQANKEEACRALESMLIARDLRIEGCWQVREIGLRSQRILGGTFSFFVF
jgi:hypothetical protein